MSQSPGSDYLVTVIKRLKYYKGLAEKTFEQLNEAEFHYSPGPESNSIAVIIQHMAGNMLSRWTDFLTTDGEKDWRNRDAEFENDIASRQELMNKWNEGWNCLFTTLDQLTEKDLDKEVYIRNQGQTVIDAINRQLAHYSHHVGQIVFIGKMVCGTKWTSLSIPKGKSNDFNADKFSKPKHTEHFTDEILKKKGG